MTDNNKAEVYRDASGQYRWTLIAADNGEIIGASTESYVRRVDAFANLSRVTGGTIPTGNVTIREQEPDCTALREGLAEDEGGAA